MSRLSMNMKTKVVHWSETFFPNTKLQVDHVRVSRVYCYIATIACIGAIYRRLQQWAPSLTTVQIIVVQVGLAQNWLVAHFC